MDFIGPYQCLAYEHLAKYKVKTKTVTVSCNSKCRSVKKLTLTDSGICIQSSFFEKIKIRILI